MPELGLRYLAAESSLHPRFPKSELRGGASEERESESLPG